MTNRAPLVVAIILFLLPVLYVGSYLALVVPSRDPFAHYNRLESSFVDQFFWPPRQIDRKARPESWGLGD